MERNRIVQNPIVEDFCHKFHECKIFSKLDMRQGYHQLLLSPESRAVATFSTPWGNIRPRRLVFGAKASQDSFDDVMQRIFGDILYCLNRRDDILIGGKNKEEHDKTLETVLQRASDFGITFSKEKCEFGVKSIEFYGYKFTGNGLMPTEEKVRAVKECKEPESKSEVKSFLGMIGYLSKFIPNYSSLTAPLRELTKKESKFRWNETEQRAFEKLKDAITNKKIMAYFNPKLPIILRTEASFHDGISAAIFQRTGEGLRPVHYISRTMTPTEKKYSQTEKDALAIAWSKKRFSIYLHGAPRFKIITAHKPLLTMFNKPSAKLPPRIEKWVMSMQDTDYELVYEPGKDERDPLDFISRHPLPETGNDKTETIIKSVIQGEHAVILSKIQEETKKDPILRKLKEIITSETWEKYRKDPEIGQFYDVKDELYLAEGLIFRMNRIVLPETLRVKVINKAHQMGHFGITRTKQMIRAKYFFPRMNAMIESILAQCYECSVTTKQHRSCPIKSTAIPEIEWDTVAMDFGGPYPDGHYNLVVIDKRTRYPEVEELKSTNAKATIKALRKIFSTHGVPRRIESDNGPPFNSHEFSKFAEEIGFYHHRVTPEHARANGEAESFMKVLNKMEQICQLQQTDRSKALQETLMGYRSTPHPATNKSPYEMLMHRRVRTMMDTISQKPEEDEVNERDFEYKEKVKKRAENRNTRDHNFIVGDYVLLKQAKRSKWTTAYEPNFYKIYRIDGSSIAARRVIDGRTVYRDASKFKLANNVIKQEERNSNHMDDEQLDDWREELLKETQTEEIRETPGSIEVASEQATTSSDEIVTAHIPREATITPKRRYPDQGRGSTTPRLPPRRSTRPKKPPEFMKDYYTDI